MEVALVVGLLKLGCVEDTGEGSRADAGIDAQADDSGGPSPDLGLVDCDPPLALVASEPKVLPLGLLTFVASGGAGQYRYAFLINASGAIVNPLTGAYLAGQTFAVTDVVTVTDLGCGGEAQASVEVVAPMQVAPLQVELLPETSFVYQVTGGSGSYRCTLEVDGSGLTLTPECEYTAGLVEATDVVEVEDVETGQTVDSTITVTLAATLRPNPALVFIPLGSTHRVSVVGGSGTFDADITGSAVTYANGVVTGVAVGSATLDLTDRFTGLNTTVQAGVVAHRTTDLLRAGDQLIWGVAHAPGDVDGDGHADALLAWPEADIAAFNGGAVFLYLGGSGGLSVAPALTLTGTTWVEEAGRSLTSADFDGDGRVDIAVGAPLADVGLTDNGEVRIHYGTASGLPAATPATAVDGAFASDWLGYALAACDFNDDGWTDLAVGARFAEDRDALMPATDQGAAFVFLGDEDGFADDPQLALYGQAPDGLGGWADAPGMRLGTSMASGDVDGDGVCDLVVGSFEYTTAVGRGQDGAVFVYRGVPSGPSGIGGPTDLPSLAWAASSVGQEATFFGRHVAVGDLDRDGLDDIAVGQYRQNAVAGVNERHGAVRVFAGRVLGALPATAFDVPESADWSYVADNPFDSVGYWVEIADADGDGFLDLQTGGLGDEAAGGTANAGAVLFFQGQDGAWPAATPDATVGGLLGADYFGQTFATLGDADGDAEPDLLVMAALDDTLGLNVGRPYFVSGASPVPYLPLDLPGASSGQQVGRSVAVVGDLDGDGLADLVIGAPDAETAQDRINQGVAHLYLGSPTGFATAPALTFANHTGHGGFEQFGWDVGHAGDFDGDGRPDLAVLARFDDRPATFGPEYVNPADCPGAVTDPAAVLVFKGVASGLPSAQPAFVFYGPQGGQIAEQVTGGFDYDGDGFDDLLLGGPSWDRPGRANVGGFAIISGRPANPAGITVICAADYVWLGLAANDQSGLGLAGLGDLDGDGCDEFALGTWLEDLGVVNQGTVRVFRGWGGAGCPVGPEATTLGSLDAGGGAGFALGGGADVDGDALFDLGVGAPFVVVDGNAVGAAWLLRGANILALPTEPVVDDVAPGMVWPLSSGAESLRVDGVDQQELFGNSVVLVPNVEADGRGALAVGGPLGSVNGTARTGGVRIFRYNLDAGAGPIGLELIAAAAMGGESNPTDSRIGETLGAGLLGSDPVLVVGGTRADASALDRGAAYVVDLD